MSDPSTGGTSQALVFGVDDEDTPSANAVVRIGDGCTGTLIAPDLSLTAGHCGDHGLDIRDPWQPPEGSRCTDKEVPGRWYPTAGNMPWPIRISVGNKRSRPRFSTTATDYAIPGCAPLCVRLG